MIDVTNFKSINSCSFELTSLNVLSGINGSGKSTVCQVLLLLKEFFEHFNPSESTASLNNRYMQLGKIGDVLHEGASLEQINFLLQIDGRSHNFNLDAATEFKGNDYIKVVFDESNYAQIAPVIERIKYLRAERVGPRVVQEKNDYSVRMLRDIGISGEYVNSFLEYFGADAVDSAFDARFHINSDSDSLFSQVSAWLTEICPNITFSTTELLHTDFVSIQYKFQTKLGHSQDYRATNVGFGLSYILPVIVMCLSAKPGDIIIIDTPEAHLHPRGQSKIGELLARTAVDGIQVIVETHSDHVINGMRKQVLQRRISPTDIKFFYFKLEAGIESISPVTVKIEPRLNENAMFDVWPDGFFDEWSSAQAELIKFRSMT